MKIKLLLLWFLANNVLAADIPSTCQRVVIKEHKIPIRIPDSQLPPTIKTPIFRTPNLRGGECLTHKSSGQCNLEGIGNRTIFNSKGYTPDDWALEFPDIPSDAPDYCKNCNEQNSGNEYYGTQNAYGGILDHIEYKGCKDKNDVDSPSNTDGCYGFKIETEQVFETYACTIYVCKTTDVVFGEFGVDTANLYSCQVQCERFNAPSSYSMQHNAYICKRPPVPQEPDEDDSECEASKVKAWGCLKSSSQNVLDEANMTLKDRFDELYTKLLDFFNLRDENNDNENQEPGNDNSENPTFQNVELPGTTEPFSFSNFLQNLFPTDATCPNQRSIELLENTYSFSFDYLCELLAKLGNLVMALSIYSAYRIVRS